jgi:hypothetical protein
MYIFKKLVFFIILAIFCFSYDFSVCDQEVLNLAVEDNLQSTLLDQEEDIIPDNSELKSYSYSDWVVSHLFGFTLSLLINRMLFLFW